MMPATLEFSIDRYAMYPSVIPSDLEENQLPADFGNWVDSKGDRFRDTFSRICLYLAKRYMAPSNSPSNETVIVGTEYGNLEAMLRFQHQARIDHRALSAQQFPHATTSSASTFINISQSITGGNATLNAGALTPALALLHGLLHINDHEHARSHIFVGDTYCSEALDDIHKHAPSAQASSGVLYLGLNKGHQFRADVRFEKSAEFLLEGLTSDVRIYLDSTSRTLVGQQCPPNVNATGSTQREHNRAFVFAAFMEGLMTLRIGQRAALLLTHQSSAAIVLVSRHHE